MKLLLRSLFRVNPNDRPDELLANYEAISTSRIVPSRVKTKFSIVEDQVLYAEIQQSVTLYGHIPDSLTLRNHFQSVGETEVVKRLAYLESIQCVTKGDFLRRLSDIERELVTQEVETALVQAADITRGVVSVDTNGKKTTYKGAEDALAYLEDVKRNLQAEIRVNHVSTMDPDQMWSEYETARDGQVPTLPTGFSEIDQALSGLRNGQLWVHAGYAGGGKSTFLLNWIYNLVYAVPSGIIAAGLVPNRRRILYFSLEMGLRDPQNMLLAMHSGAYWGREKRLALDLPTGLHSGLPYDALLDASIRDFHPGAEAYLRDTLQDLKQNRELFGQLEIVAPDPTRGPLTIREIQDVAEAWEKNPRNGRLDMIVIDHMGLVAPPAHSGKNSWEQLAGTYQEAHRMALGFGRGRGIAVCCAHQINREGAVRTLTATEKGDVIPRYNLMHLSGSSEVERSADVVTSSFISDAKEDKSLILIDCLKSRHKKAFDPFMMRIDWPTRRMRSQATIPGAKIITPREFFSGAQQTETSQGTVKDFDV